ncbi:hypothetical protein GBA65_07155 [Rubrobacter marinus]|uniref:Uncharacterized protein n=1 Tax=Rubrobacter marinus TaxID=2653852 RepID=A0A6G8PVU8_9ACTN|nr:hypothetical protein [Rubrobacter marinus]QIN78332.1 hypothetical protein GBA65_07155 [Rubrobacter marinus]
MRFDFGNINDALWALDASEQARAAIDYRSIAEIASRANLALRAADVAAGLNRPFVPPEPIARLAAADSSASSLASVAEQGRRSAIGAALSATEISRPSALGGLTFPKLDAGISGLARSITPAFDHLAGARALAAPEIFGFTRGLGRLFDNYSHAADSINKIFEAVPPLADWPRIDCPRIDCPDVGLPAEEPFDSMVFAALEVWDEFGRGRCGAADAFMTRRLKLRRPRTRWTAYDRRQALWVVLRSAFERPSGDGGLPPWMEMEDEGEVAAYLRTAIFAEVRRIERDREVPERVWWKEKDLPEGLSEDEKTEREKPSFDPEIMRLIRGTTEDPADVVIRWESYEIDARFQALALLHHHGTQRDRDMATLVLKGYEPVDLAHVYGWPKVQAFQRKARTWRVKKVGKLPFGSG